MSPLIINGRIRDDKEGQSIIGGVIDKYLDFADFAVVDGPSKISRSRAGTDFNVTKNRLTLAKGDRDEDYYATKDFSDNHFEDFTHHLDVNVTFLTNDGAALMIPWGVADVIDDFLDIDTASGDCFFIVLAHDTAATYQININNCDGGTLTGGTAITGISVATASYLSINRTTTTATLEIYSTAALRSAGGSGDVGTVTLTVVDTPFRYLYGLGSYATGDTAKDISGTVSNLTIIK